MGAPLPFTPHLRVISDFGPRCGLRERARVSGCSNEGVLMSGTQAYSFHHPSSPSSLAKAAAPKRDWTNFKLGADFVALSCQDICRDFSFGVVRSMRLRTLGAL